MTNEVNKTKILVVDDDPAIQAAIERILRSAGYEVTVSPYIATLLSSALGGRYDLITLDINMPGIDGSGVAASFHEKKIDTKIVVVSGFVDAVKDELLEAGIRHFVSKPFTAEGLLDAIRDALGENPDDASDG